MGGFMGLGSNPLLGILGSIGNGVAGATGSISNAIGNLFARAPTAAGAGTSASASTAPVEPTAAASPNFGMFGMGPLSWTQKLGLMLNAASDAANARARMPSQNFGNALGMLQAQRQLGARAGLAQALASGDETQMRNAKALALSLGLDLTPFLPRYQDVRPGGALVGIDPLTGEARETFQAQLRTRPGYHWETMPDGGTVERYDAGGPADPQVIAEQTKARASAAAGARNAPRAKGAASAGKIAEPPGPWQNYGDE